MDLESYYYNCSQEYIESIDAGLHDEIAGASIIESPAINPFQGV